MSDNLTSILRTGLIGVGLVSATILLGCSSGDPAATGASGTTGGAVTPPPTPAGSGASKAAQTDFETNVYPLLDKEGCTGCHVTGVKGAPKYLGTDAATSYTQIKTIKAVYTDSATSALLTKGDHQGATGLSAAGVTAAKKWLDAEFPPKADPGGDVPNQDSGGGSVVGFNAVIQEFVKCMVQDDWEQHMKFYPMVQTQNFGPCAGCHEDGNGGTFLNADFNVTFKAMKTVPYVYRLVAPVYDGDTIVDLEPSNRLIDKGQISTDCFDPNNVICHDTFNVPKVQAQGLKNFQNLALGGIQDLKCVNF